MDAELQQVFNLVVSRGINLFDTADSYGERGLLWICRGSVTKSVRKQGIDIALVSNWMHAKPRAVWNAGTGVLNGRSEQLLGDFVRSYPGSAEVQGNIRIATKLAPYPWRIASAQFAAACRYAILHHKHRHVYRRMHVWAPA